MVNYISLLRFHLFHKIHVINRNNFNKSWLAFQNEKNKLKLSEDRDEYIRILKKYGINNLT